MAKTNNSKLAILVEINAKSYAINEDENPVNVANFRPIRLAINAAGIDALATPNIIIVIGSVANEGSSIISVAKIAPVKTITGEADMANGCAINNSHILRGNLINRASNNVVINNSARVIKMFENINTPSIVG